MRDPRKKLAKLSRHRRRAMLALFIFATSPLMADGPQINSAGVLPPLPLTPVTDGADIHSNPFCEPAVNSLWMPEVQLASGSNTSSIRLKPIGAAIGLHSIGGNVPAQPSRPAMTIETVAPSAVRNNPLVGSMHHVNQDLVDAMVDDRAQSRTPTNLFSQTPTETKKSGSSIVLLPPAPRQLPVARNESIPTAPQFPVDRPAVAEQSAVSQPIAAQPIAAEDFDQPPTAQPPTAQQPVGQPPVAQQPVAQPPVAQQPVAQPPVAQQPVAQQPVAQQPVAQQPVAQPPVVQQPVAQQPVAQQPVAQQPVAQQPVAQQPVAQRPDQPQPAGSSRPPVDAVPPIAAAAPPIEVVEKPKDPVFFSLSDRFGDSPDKYDDADESSSTGSELTFAEPILLDDQLEPSLKPIESVLDDGDRPIAIYRSESAMIHPVESAVETLKAKRYRPPVAVKPVPIAVERSRDDSNSIATSTVQRVQALNLGGPEMGSSQTKPTPLYMTRAQVRSLTLGGDVRRVKVGDRQICEAFASGPNQLKLIGTGNGVTRLVVWADSEDADAPTRVRAFDVHVEDSVDSTGDAIGNKTAMLNHSIRSAFPTSSVDVRHHQGQLVVTGRCDSEASAIKIIRMVRKTCLVPVQDELLVR